MAEYVGAEIKSLRIPPCFSKFRSNVPTDDHINGTAVIQQYYKRNIAIPSLDTSLSDIKSRLKDGRNHAEIFGLLPSVMFTPEYKINEIAAALRKQFSADLPNHGMQLLNELRRWKTFWEKEMQQRRTEGGKPVHHNRGKKVKSSCRVDGKKSYELLSPPDGLLEALKKADEDFFPCIRKLLLIGCVPPIRSTETERAASGVRCLITPYRSTMTDIREANLNLIQLQRIVNINIDEVAQIFLQSHPRRLFGASVLFS